MTEQQQSKSDMHEAVTEMATKMAASMGIPADRVEVINMDSEANPLGKMFADTYVDFLHGFCNQACEVIRNLLGAVVESDQLERVLAEAGLRAPISGEEEDSTTPSERREQAIDDAVSESDAFDRDLLLEVLTEARDALADQHRASQAATAAVRRTRDVAVRMGIIETDAVSDL